MKKILIFLGIVFLIGFIYRDGLTSYFFQDDWFSLRISQAHTIEGFFSFFIPRSDVIYYRPLGMQVPFFFLQNLFGIHPFPFHLIQFFTHIVNSILVYVLVNLILKKKREAFLASFLYATSSIHYISFYWFSTFAFVLGPTFFFTSFIFFIRFLDKQKQVYFFFSFFCFTLGLLVNEMIIVAPCIFFFFILFLRRKEAKKLFSLLPYVGVSILFIALRFFLFSPPIFGLYSMTVGKHILNNLEAYLLWSFNWPEEMKAQLINFFTVNPEFIKGFPNYYFVFFFSLFFFIVFWYVIPTILIFREQKTIIFPIMVFCLSWFIIGLLPVLFFSQHTFSYYLPISFVGFLIGSLVLLDIFFKKIERTSLYSFSIISILIIWILVNITTIDFNQKVHWAPRRAERAKLLVKKARMDYSPRDLMISVFSSSENKLSLNDQDAFKIIFANENIITHYTTKEEAKNL